MLIKIDNNSINAISKTFFSDELVVVFDEIQNVENFLKIFHSSGNTLINIKHKKIWIIYDLLEL